MTMAYNTIYLLINNTNLLRLELDVDTVNEITATNQRLYEYVTQLQQNKVIDITAKIQNIHLSYDNNNFEEVYCSKPVMKNDEEHAKDEPKEDTTWKDNATKLLLDKYEQYLPNVGPMKKFKKKKSMWEQIAKDIQEILGIEKTGLQCENRFKTVMKRKKTAECRNNLSGENPSPVEFGDELAKIAAIDDSIAPEVQMGVGKCVQRNKFQVEASPSSSSDEYEPKSKIKKRRTTLQKTLWDIQKYKEEQRAKRHEEKMELLRTLGEKLSK